MMNHHLKGVIEVEDMMEAYLTFGEAHAIFYATTAYCADSPSAGGARLRERHHPYGGAGGGHHLG